jgi:hypothetical protein
MSKIISLFTSNILVRLVVESLLATFKRIAWAEVIERLLLRLIKRSLRKLASMTSNNVDDQLVEEVIASLENRALPRVN